ncbi:MAG TPA: nuclear transport factor 2 family protein [Blastocatellia bacterium]|nr:nuclear transport factor 2 family protein [Blastocatellia bacterium]
MITTEFARAYAQDWIEAWNSHDLERIFSHYADDFEMSSPLIVERMKEPSGTLRGKAAIRPYFQPAMTAQPPLHFELLGVLTGVNSITILYRNQAGRSVAEVIAFNDRQQAVKGSAHYE